MVGKVTGVEIDQGRAKVSFSVKDSVKVPLMSNDPCMSGTGSLGNAAQSQAARQTGGAAAVSQLLSKTVSG